MPLLNASLTDCVFEVERPTTVEEVNGCSEPRPTAAAGHPRLRGAAAGLGRLQGRPALRHRRRALDHGRRRHAGEGAGLVRQREGLREPHGRAGRKVARSLRASSGRPGAVDSSTPASRRATCATTSWSPAPTGRSRSPTARPACSSSSTSTSWLQRRSSSPSCSSSTRSSASSRTSSAAGSRAPRPQDDALIGLAFRSSRSRCSPFAPGPWLVGAVRHGRAGALRHRQGPHQDELQERHQVRRRPRTRRLALQVGRRSSRARRTPSRASASSSAACCSRSLGFQPALLVLMALVAAGSGRRPDADARRASEGRIEGEVRRRCSRRAARSTSSRRRASSCSPRATSGSSSACRSSCAASSAGASGRSAGFLAVWVIGYGIVQARRRASAAAWRRPGDPDGRTAARAGLPARGVPGGDRHRAAGRRRPDAGGRRAA